MTNYVDYVESGKDKFEIVEKIPKDFFVWNIGVNAPEGYLPLCEWLDKNDKSNYSINPETLKAISLPEPQRELLLKAAGYGISCKADAEKELASKREAKTYIDKKKRFFAKHCIDIFNEIS